MQVGFVGLGNMGSAMAANLLAAGHALTVYNRTAAKADTLVAKGARRGQTPADAAQGEIVITMLADDHAVEQAVFGAHGLLEALAPGAIHLSMGTISTALAERLDHAHLEKGQELVSAPVFGRPDAAAAAKLFIVPAGRPEAVATCVPVFRAIGQRHFVVGERAPMANLVKVTGNFLIASVIEALSESMALVGKGGVDRALFVEILTSTLFGAPVYKTYGTLIAEERFEPAGFKTELGLKDVGLALQAAKELKAPMPLASLIADRFLTLIASGGASLDWSALALVAKRDAGEETALGSPRT
jgi:3-hydroxyisobutyrate dehydrogenase-like beta-hydroxyacid dehydrogenase